MSDGCLERFMDFLMMVVLPLLVVLMVIGLIVFVFVFVFALVLTPPVDALQIYQDTKAQCIERGISERECEAIALQSAYPNNNSTTTIPMPIFLPNGN